MDGISSCIPGGKDIAKQIHQPVQGNILLTSWLTESERSWRCHLSECIPQDGAKVLSWTLFATSSLLPPPLIINKPIRIQLKPFSLVSSRLMVSPIHAAREGVQFVVILQLSFADDILVTLDLNKIAPRSSTWTFLPHLSQTIRRGMWFKTVCADIFRFICKLLYPCGPVICRLQQGCRILHPAKLAMLIFNSITKYSNNCQERVLDSCSSHTLTAACWTYDTSWSGLVVLVLWAQFVKPSAPAEVCLHI